MIIQVLQYDTVGITRRLHSLFKGMSIILYSVFCVNSVKTYLSRTVIDLVRRQLNYTKDNLKSTASINHTI